MATMTSANLLELFNQLSGRPASGDSIADAGKYVRLSAAQNVMLEDGASRVPQAFYAKTAYGSTPTLTTTDNQVFTFGTDVNSNPLFPIGKFRIFENLSAIPDYPWVEGEDYLWEGTQIRIPNNQTYGGTLYWRGIAPVLDITSTNQPSIIPVSFRVGIVYEAVRRYALEGNRNLTLAATMQTSYDKLLARWCLTLKTARSSGVAGGSVSGLRLSMLAGYGVGYGSGA
jgi:hypothetical protein